METGTVLLIVLLLLMVFFVVSVYLSSRRSKLSLEDEDSAEK